MIIPICLALASQVVPSMIESAQIRATVEHLAAYPSRHTLSPHGDEAGAWIESRFKDLGYGVERHAFDHRGARPFNVVATKRGDEKPDEFIVLGAHYDSRMERLGDEEAPAPGADDNASGVAAMLEVARALKDVPTPRSIRFIAFSGEEQGLVGSRAYAAMAKESGMYIQVLINLDMIGRPIDAAKRRIVVEHDPGLRVKENDAASREWADRLFAAIKAEGLQPVEGAIYGSDYIPFESVGFPCIGLFDGADEQLFYHTGDDLPEGVDFNYCAAASRAVAAIIVAPAGRPDS